MSAYTCGTCGRFCYLSRSDRDFVAMKVADELGRHNDLDKDAGWDAMRAVADVGICRAACDENDWQDVLVSAYDRHPQCDLEDWVPREGRDDEV